MGNSQFQRKDVLYQLKIGSHLLMSDTLATSVMISSQFAWYFHKETSLLNRHLQ
jgi:hypothetical protein